MPKSVTARVTPEMLRWAREQAGCDLEQAGKAAGKDADTVAAWESPESGQLPTIRQARKLAGAYRVALAADNDAPATSDKEQVLEWWIERVENLGAFVSRYRPDGNKYWVVEPSEARGLSLCHPLAPYITLNSRDAPAGRTFTLLHELAHIYYGRCGVDDLGDEGLAPVDARVLEQRCNRVAAAVLMPDIRFRLEWERAAGSVAEKAQSVANVFGVSRQAAAVRARAGATQLISEEQYGSILDYLADEYREFRESRPVRGGGGMNTRTRVLKDFGTGYTRLVFEAHSEGRLSRLDVANALDVRLSDIDGISSRL